MHFFGQSSTKILFQTLQFANGNHSPWPRRLVFSEPYGDLRLVFSTGRSGWICWLASLDPLWDGNKPLHACPCCFFQTTFAISKVSGKSQMLLPQNRFQTYHPLHSLGLYIMTNLQTLFGFSMFTFKLHLSVQVCPPDCKPYTHPGVLAHFTSQQPCLEPRPDSAHAK